jgi:tetratricopeptide (TPR) repeat protein
MTLLGQGKPEAALTALIEFNSHEESWNPYVEYLRADLHRRRGELEPSIKGFEEVTRRAEPFVHTYLHLANLHNRTQEISRSLEAYFNAYSTQLAVLGEVVGLGRQLLAEDKVNEASLLLKDLVSQMAINPKAHRATGLEFLRYRRYEEAFRHLARAYLSEPNSAELVFSLAVACFKTQRFEAARILCQKLEAHFPTEPVAQKKAQELLKLMEKTVPPKG